MHSSKPLATIATFVAAALVAYLLGTILLWVWPMWSMMWSMMGFGPDPVLALVVVALVAGTIWVIARNIYQRDAGAVSVTARCPRCRAAVEPDYVLCPECHTTLGPPCRECQRPLRAHWIACPYCGVKVAGTPSVDEPVVVAARRIEPGSRDNLKVARDGRG